MSAPFPTEPSAPSRTQAADPHAAVFAPTDVIIIKERAAHVPSFYQQHEDPTGTTVVQNGLPVGRGFTVADMAPERRWAVKEDGEVLDEQTFRAKLTMMREEWFRKCTPEGVVPRHWKPESEYIPQATKYVSQGVDPFDPSKYREIGFDPNATAGAKAEKLGTQSQDEVNFRPRMEVLLESYRDPNAVGRMTAAEIGEVRAYLGGEVPVVGQPNAGDVLQARFDELNALKADGIITEEQYMKRITAIAGGVPIVEEAPAESAEAAPPKKPRKAPMKTMDCGETIPIGRIRKHKVECEKCAPQESTE